MLHNFTVIDLFGSTAGALLLTLFVFVPGYVAGWLTNVFGFRQERPAMRVLLSTPLGVAVVPILIFLLGRYPIALWSFFGAVWIVLAGVAVHQWQLSAEAARLSVRSAEAETPCSEAEALGSEVEAPGFSPVNSGAEKRGFSPGSGEPGLKPEILGQSSHRAKARCFHQAGSRLSCVPREVWIGLAVVLGWAALAILSVSDFQLGRQLFNSVTAYDHSVRSAMTAAAARGIPPTNPFFAGRPAVMLRYHYFWMLVCSLVTRLSGISPRLAMLGSVVWGEIALLSLIPIGLRYLAGVRQGLGRTTLMGFALLTVTGLDLLPVLYISHFRAPVYADMEWWNTQITSWADVLLWTPHHVLAMIACLLGFLVLRHAIRSRSQPAISVGIAALAFASACGLSTLVTLTFAVFLALWLVVAACRGWWDEFPLFLLAGVLALILSLPSLRMYFGPGGSESGHSGFVGFAVRDFPLAMRMLGKHFGWRHHLWIANLLLLPLNYFLELGFFLLVAGLRLRTNLAAKVRLSREEAAAWTIIATSFLIGSFVRSNTLASNDIGWRCFLPAQFVLLLWGAVLLDRGRVCPSSLTPTCWRVARVLLIVGALGTVYQVITLRFYPVEWVEADALSGKRTFALRSIYDQLDAQLPRDAIVQYNPQTKFYIPHLFYSGHGAAVGLPNCGYVFGGQVSVCAPRETAIDGLFSPSAGSAALPESVCRAYGINVLVATDTDAVWNQPRSWVWTRQPLFANSYARAFRCGS